MYDIKGRFMKRRKFVRLVASMPLLKLVRLKELGVELVESETLTLDMPVCKEGDMLFMAISSDKSSIISAPSGWTTQQEGYNDECYQGIYYKEASRDDNGKSINLEFEHKTNSIGQVFTVSNKKDYVEIKSVNTSYSCC